MIFKKKQKNDKIKIKYGIIRRQGDKLGLFSLFITILGGMHYCYNNGLIPIVDLKTGDNQYKRYENDNAWEIFFEQPEEVGLGEVKNWSEVQIIDCDQIFVRPQQNMDFFTNKNAIEYWRAFVKKHIRLSGEARICVEEFIEQYLLPYKNEKILGVLARGTDYTDLKPLQHPVQPTFNELREKIDEVFNESGCSKIFLVTEDKRICNQFLEYYGNLIILPEEVRYGETNGKYLSDIKKNEENLVASALSYLGAVIGLARCKYFVAGRTSGTVAAVILSEGYEGEYFFNLGKYGVDDKETLRIGDV